jgi:muramoyltetrapeptide carboxypeptidase
MNRNLVASAGRSSEKTVRIGICAPGVRLTPDLVDRLASLTTLTYGDRVELVVHPQCFSSSGHFAGTDEERVQAVLDLGNDPALDAVWFGRGGYGACRIGEAVLGGLGPHSRTKKWMGYSDAGFLLGGLFKAGYADVAHGPMPVDLLREGGEEAVRRALSWLVDNSGAGLEPHVGADGPSIAFNLTILSHLLGTPLEPDLSGRVVQLEDVGEYMYRIDRAMFHVTSSANVRRCAGIRLGRLAPVPENTPDFRLTAEDVFRYWCERSGIAFLGGADIGHDIENKIVAFG